MSMVALTWALWLGVLTSISPCPLASNVAAISFIARHATQPRRVLWTGLAYTLGRTAAYVLLGVLLLAAAQWVAVSRGEVSRFLLRYANQALGPVLILVGMLLLELIGSRWSLTLVGAAAQERVGRAGPVGAAVLGFLFALSFCPVSAGLFFGALLTYAAEARSVLIVPTLYGVGTAAPVVFFAFLIAFAGAGVGRVFGRLTRVETWVRVATGVVFVLVGVYYCLRYIYELPLGG